MTFTTSADDMYKKKAVLAFKWFLAQTGRWRDEEAEEAILNHILNSVDSLGVLETGLELYQGETIGKCLLNCGDIAFVCKSLAKKQDVMLKNKGDYIDIIELQPKKKPKEKPPFAGEPVAYLNEEYRLKGWQKETMEEDAARAGYLFGEPG